MPEPARGPSPVPRTSPCPTQVFFRAGNLPASHGPASHTQVMDQMLLSALSATGCTDAAIKIRARIARLSILEARLGISSKKVGGMSKSVDGID